MDRIINVNVGGNYISKDNKNAGVRGEGNVTYLRITFDEGWDNYAKKVTFWDARGGNPVERTLTTDLIENIKENPRLYLVPIPAEPMAEAGTLTFIIDGYSGDGLVDGKRQRSISDQLEVKDAPIADNAGEPTYPTPTQAEQLQQQIDDIIENISDAVEAKDQAEAFKNEAKQSAAEAERSAGKASYIGDNGNWFAWDSKAGEFYDTGVKAQAGSTVYVGENPPDDADVWINPNGEFFEPVKYLRYEDYRQIDFDNITETGIYHISNHGAENFQYDAFFLIVGDEDGFIHQTRIRHGRIDYREWGRDPDADNFNEFEDWKCIHATQRELEAVKNDLLVLTNKVAPSPATITLYADRWEKEAGETMWSQEVVVVNATITPYSKIDLQLSAEQIAIFYEKDLAFVTENDGGKVTVYSIGRVPENDYVLQATVSEVLVNG